MAGSNRIPFASRLRYNLSILNGSVPHFDWLTLLPLAPAAAFVLYSTTAHYQRPTAALVCDSLGFIAGLGLWISLALHAPSLWLRALLTGPVVLFLAVFFIGNKLCYRFFKDWVHHQMVLEWRVGGSIFWDSWKSMQPWEWIGGLILPLAATGATLTLGRPAPPQWSIPIAAGAMIACAVVHALVRSRSFDTDEHNPFMNFLRGWLGELKGMNARRAMAIASRIRPAPWHGYRYTEAAECPLVQEPREDAPPRPPLVAVSGRPPNVVLIVLESVRALECGAYGAAPSFTPNFDAIARDGLLLKNFYANGSQTVRGELSLLCSFYDHFGGAPLYVRNPALRLRSLPEILRERGYRTLWISSYTASFHNKERFLRCHGIDEIHDDRGLPAGLPRINWGPADEALFEHAQSILDRQREPFFAEIMTLTNHWPFPGPYPTCERTPIVSTEKLYTNFTRGVYYTDHALGCFLESARRAPWFDNTIFIITSDHGAWIYPDDLPLGAIQKQEAYFRMPMLFYAPKLIEPGVLDVVTSQVDVAPTLLDLLGIRTRHAFIGRSAFDPADPCSRHALMLHWHTWNIRIGNRYLYTVGKSFEAKDHRASRPDDARERRGTMHAFFEAGGDVLREPESAVVIRDSAAQVEALSRWGDDLLYLVDFLRVRNRVYDRPPAPAVAASGDLLPSSR
jgi:arylsulfatase A-like enzyme